MVRYIVVARIYKQTGRGKKTLKHSLPRPLCSVGRYQQPGPGQRVVPAVGDIVEDLVGHVTEKRRWTGKIRTAERSREDRVEVSRRMSRLLYLLRTTTTLCSNGRITRTNKPVIGPSDGRWCYSLIPRHTAPGLVGRSSLKLSP